MEYEVQYAKITTTGKLPDRFLNCQSKSTSDLGKVYMGTTYSLVEILSPWFTTSQVGQAIINTFSQAYYEGASTSDLDNFEEALKKVNENLGQITANGETNWIGNLNAILAIVIENKIHLAQAGAAEAYIFREGKTNHLTYGLAQTQAETHPLKTFSNITSGELKLHDKVLIANPDLVKCLDLNVLREIITMNSANEAVMQIARILKKKKCKTVNLLILDLLTLEEVSRKPVSASSNNVHLDKPIETVAAYWDKFWRQILKPILVFLGQSLQKLGVGANKMIQKQAQKVKDKKQAEIARQSDSFGKDFLAENTKDGLFKDEEIEYSPELNVHYYEQQKNKKEDKLEKFLTGTLQFGQNVWTWLVATYKNRRTRPYLLGGLVVIVILILILAISGSRHKGGSKLTLLEAQNILRSAEAAQKEGQTAALSSNNDKAKEKYFECTTQAKKITSVEIIKADTTNVLNICQTELDKLTSTIRFDKLNVLVAGNSSIESSFIVGGQVFLVSKNEIFASTINGGKIDRVASLPRNNGDIRYGASSGQKIYLYTSEQKVYEFDIKTEKLTLSKVGGSWSKANAASFYMGNLYLLDGAGSQIYKHALDQDSFSVGQNYVSAGSARVKDGVSITIDGSIYVLRSNGELLKFQRGQIQEFAVSNIPSPQSQFEKPIKVYTDSDTTSIYILDAKQKRIVELDKSGSFIHQFSLPDSFNDLKDFTVSTKAKKIWVLNAGNLYEISI